MVVFIYYSRIFNWCECIGRNVFIDFLVLVKIIRNSFLKRSYLYVGIFWFY